MAISIYQRLGSALLTLSIASSVVALAPKHGWLKTEKNMLLNEKGNIVQLRGLSFYWSTPGWIGIANYNAATVNALATDWKCTVVRAAYDRNNGNDNGWNEVKTVIDAAIAKGIYVILDWHSHTAEKQEAAAVAFFTQKAKDYMNIPNVIFEPYNEPIVFSGDQKDGSALMGQKTWAGIKPYLTNVTKAIRATGSKNLIILGTPYYCQHVGVAAQDPVEKSAGVPYENVAYAFHFYAASHGPEAMYVDRDGGGMEATYLDAGINSVPVFVTEWGTTHSDGAQSIDEKNTNWWFDTYINKYHLSWCNWSASSGETSSAFSGGTNPSASGTLVKKLLNASAIDTFVPISVSGNIGPAKDTVHSAPVNYLAAARFNRFYGTHAESASVAYSYRDKVDRRIPGIVGYVALKVTPATEENWVSYNLNSTTASSKIALRCHTKDGKGTIQFLLDGTKATELVLPADTTWKTSEVPLSLTPGAHTLKLNFTGSTGTGYLIEWMEIGNGTSAGTVNSATFIRFNAEALTINSGRSVTLPPGHAYTGYSVIGANGRVAQSGTINACMQSVSLNNLPAGMWLLTFDRPGASDLLKAIISDK